MNLKNHYYDLKISLISLRDSLNESIDYIKNNPSENKGYDMSKIRTISEQIYKLNLTINGMFTSNKSGDSDLLDVCKMIDTFKL